MPPRLGREGSRWYNQPPEPSELADWFQSNVRLHEGMEHKDYIGGIALIQQSSTNRQAFMGLDDAGQPILAEQTEIVYTPYPRVETRVSYFWRLMELHPHWTGSISPAHVPAQSDFLPEGFFRYEVAAAKEHAPERVVAMVGRAMVVRILDHRGGDLHYFPPEVKTVPLLDRFGNPDEHAFARASTGAIGRALGVAGMLVLPGTGIATAEDMLEVAGAAPAAADGVAVAPPQESPDQARAKLYEQISFLLKSDAREQFMDWWREREFPDAEKVTDEQVKIARQMADRLVPGAKLVEHAAG